MVIQLIESFKTGWNSLEIKFTVKVVSIHPSYDNQGNEYVCVESGFRPVKMPTMVPTSVPKEVSEMIEASKQMVKVVVPPQIRAQMRTYANRLFLFLTTDEWENLEKKYTVGDEFEVTVKPDGNITAERKV